MIFPHDFSVSSIVNPFLCVRECQKLLLRLGYVPICSTKAHEQRLISSSGLKNFRSVKKGLEIKKLSERLVGINQYTAAKSLVQSICFRVLVLVFCCAVFGCGWSREAIKRRRQQQAVDFNARLNDWVCVFTHLTYDRSSCGFALATKTLIVITSRHAMSLVSTFVENQWITLNDGKRSAYVHTLHGTLKQPLFAATVFHCHHHQGTSIIVRHTFIYER